MLPGPSGWSFGEAEVRPIEQLLHAFLVETDARCALLVDRAGQLLTSVGDRPEFDSTAFATLAAADFSANDQLASMVGEQEFSALFHQGERESMYLADVAKRVILIVLFDERATLGMIRIKVRTLVRALTEELQRILKSSAGRQLPRLDSDWSDEAELEIDRLFGS